MGTVYSREAPLYETSACTGIRPGTESPRPRLVCFTPNTAEQNAKIRWAEFEEAGKIHKLARLPLQLSFPIHQAKITQVVGERMVRSLESSVGMTFGIVHPPFQVGHRINLIIVTNMANLVALVINHGKCHYPAVVHVSIPHPIGAKMAFNLIRKNLQE
jgi:hypothetical protein